MVISASSATPGPSQPLSEDLVAKLKSAIQASLNLRKKIFLPIGRQMILSLRFY